MPPQPKPQDPALLDGASSRFADAFTRRTTQLPQGGNPRPRPWAWIAGAAALTAVVVLVVFAIAKLPSGSGDKQKTAAAASASPAPSGAPLSAVPQSGPSAPGHQGGAKGGAAAPNGGSGAKPAGTSGGSGGDAPATTGGGTNTAPGSTSGSQSASGSGSSSGGSTGTRSNSDTQKEQTVTYPGVTVYSHDSGRCISATGSKSRKAVDGTRLEIWDCGGGSWQKIDFRSDGSARIYGLCMDIAWASQDNGAPIQLAACNGGWAQKFKLNSAHDLVNTTIGKCVDVVDKGTANGTKLQLWSCYGTDNQKWSKR